MNSAPEDITNDSRTHALALTRHEHWRGQGVPTLSCLVGPSDVAVSFWALFYSERGILSLTTASLQELGLADCVASLACNIPTAQDYFIRWLSERTGRAATDIDALLRHDAPAEKRLLLEQAGIMASDWHMVRYIPGLRDLWPAPLLQPLDLSDALCVLAQALGQDALPALLLCLPDTADAETVKHEISLVETLFSRLPPLRVGVAMDAHQASQVCRRLSGTRQGTLIEEGMVRLTGTPQSVTTVFRPEEADAALRIARLLSPQAREPAIAAWRKAAERLGAVQPRKPDRQDHFRSAVERFLFLMLESHSETRGRFRANHCVNTRSGRLPRTEVDFLAPIEGLAVEVDGWHHFRDAAAWRQDRLKDLTLQQEGYMVARYLAEDVMNAIDTVMHSIICALEEAEKRRHDHE